MIDVSFEILYLTSLGKYDAVVFPIHIAIFEQSHLKLLKKHLIQDGEVKIIFELLLIVFISNCFLQTVSYTTTSSQFNISIRFETTFFALIYNIFLPKRYDSS